MVTTTVQDSPAVSGLADIQQRPESAITAPPAEYLALAQQAVTIMSNRQLVPNSAEDHAPVFSQHSNPLYEAQSSVQQTKPHCKNRGTLLYSYRRFKETALDRKKRIWAEITKLSPDKKEWAQQFVNRGADLLASLANLLEAADLPTAHECVTQALYHRYREACKETKRNIGRETKQTDVMLALEIATRQRFFRYDEAALSAVVDKSSQPIRLRSGRITVLQWYEKQGTRPSPPHLATPHLSAVSSNQSCAPLGQVTPTRAIDVDLPSLSRMQSSEPMRGARLENSDWSSTGQKRPWFHNHPVGEDRQRKTARFADLTASQNDSDTIHPARHNPSDTLLLCPLVESQPEIACQPEPQPVSQDERASEGGKGGERENNDGIEPNSEYERTPYIKIESRHESEDRNQHEGEGRGEIENQVISTSISKNAGGVGEQVQTLFHPNGEPQAMEILEGGRPAITEPSAETNAPNPQENPSGVNPQLGVPRPHSTGIQSKIEPEVTRVCRSTDQQEEAAGKKIFIKLNTTEKNKQQFVTVEYSTRVEVLYSKIQARMTRRLSNKEVQLLNMRLSNQAEDEVDFRIEKNDKDTWEWVLYMFSKTKGEKMHIIATVEV